MLWVGIDPDVAVSGVATWDSKKKELGFAALSFFALYDFLSSHPEPLRVVVDAGWLNKANFHRSSKYGSAVNAQIGERTGANHQTGKLIVQMCKYLGIPVEEHRPTQSKVNAETFRKITGYSGRTNQEFRDAGMLVFGR